MAEKMAGVSTTRDEYDEILPFVERNRRALAGERKVKAAGTLDLPPLASMCCSVENDNGNQTIKVWGGLSPAGAKAYVKYKSLASWFGATFGTVNGLVGLIKSKEAVHQIEPNLEYLIGNVDGKGTSLNEFMGDIYSNSLITPWSGILVDHPSSEKRPTIKEAEDANIRPKILFYKFESIINWNYEVINNQNILSMVVLMEDVTKIADFEVTTEKQYRHLHLVDGEYHQTIYNDADEIASGPNKILVNGIPSKEIPFFWHDTGEDGCSVLDQLIDMNFHHYRISADYGGKLHYSSFSIFYETGPGANDGENQNAIIGNGVKWNGGENATFGVLQADGNADGLRISQQDDEQRMAALGAEQLRPRSSGVESAEAKSLDKVAQNSVTADIAISSGDLITKAINFCSRWIGGTEDNFYRPNTDYIPTGMDPSMLKELVAAVGARVISYKTFYESLQRGEVASTTRNSEEEQTLITGDIKKSINDDSGM